MQTLIHANCLEELPKIPNNSIDAIVADPIYPEIHKNYGYISESDWLVMMNKLTLEFKRILKSNGSTVLILQPNSQRVGSMRTWLWDYLSSVGKTWNIIQDVYWWNFTTMPNVHCQTKYGLMRPSVKYCVWIGSPDCYRNQESIMWEPSLISFARKQENRAFRKSPSGYTKNVRRMTERLETKNIVSPFNLLPFTNTDSSTSGGSKGHGASTPKELCKWWIKYISKENDTILDPFMGSGTIGLAAKELNRNYIGIEINKAMYNIAMERLNENRTFSQ